MGHPELFCWLGYLLIVFVSIFWGTWNPRVFFDFLAGKSQVQPHITVGVFTLLLPIHGAGTREKKIHLDGITNSLQAYALAARGLEELFVP